MTSLIFYYSGGFNTHSAEVTDRVRPDNVSSPAVRLHFKQPTPKNLSSDNALDMNVNGLLMAYLTIYFAFSLVCYLVL